MLKTMLELSNYVRDYISSHWSKWAPGFRVGWLRYHDQLTVIGNECTAGGDQEMQKDTQWRKGKKVWRRTLSRWGGTNMGKECRLGVRTHPESLEAFTVTVQELEVQLHERTANSWLGRPWTPISQLLLANTHFTTVNSWKPLQGSIQCLKSSFRTYTLPFQT